MTEVMRNYPLTVRCLFNIIGFFFFKVSKLLHFIAHIFALLSCPLICNNPGLMWMVVALLRLLMNNKNFNRVTYHNDVCIAFGNPSQRTMVMSFVHAACFKPEMIHHTDFFDSSLLLRTSNIHESVCVCLYKYFCIVWPCMLSHLGSITNLCDGFVSQLFFSTTLSSSCDPAFLTLLCICDVWL